MTRRSKVALLLVTVSIAAAAQLAPARSVSLARFSTQEEISFTSVSGQHADSAVVPGSQLAHSIRAAVELLGVPLAGVLALVALLAMWFVASVRRRERVALALVTYRRRGPPVPLPVT